MVSFLSEVDFHGETVAASGTANGVLAAATGKPKCRPAMGTFVVNMGAAIPQAVVGKGEKSCDLAPNPQKRLIFPPPRRDVAGETAEEHPYRVSQQEDREDVPSGKQVEDGQNKIKDQKGIAQLIVSVSTVHKLHEFLFEFFHIISLSRGVSRIITS